MYFSGQLGFCRVAFIIWVLGCVASRLSSVSAGQFGLARTASCISVMGVFISSFNVSAGQLRFCAMACFSVQE